MQSFVLPFGLQDVPGASADTVPERFDVFRIFLGVNLVLAFEPFGAGGLGDFLPIGRVGHALEARGNRLTVLLLRLFVRLLVLLFLVPFIYLLFLFVLFVVVKVTDVVNIFE